MAEKKKDQESPRDAVHSAHARTVDKLEKDLREQQIETQTQNLLTNVPSQGSENVALGHSKAGKEKELLVSRVGSDIIVSIGSESVVFSGNEGVAHLSRTVSNAVGQF